jgi:hypothetical protein
MATYSDTTSEVLTLAFEKLRGSIPDHVLEQLKQLAADGRLDDVSTVKALLEVETGSHAENR